MKGGEKKSGFGPPESEHVDVAVRHQLCFWQWMEELERNVGGVCMSIYMWIWKMSYVCKAWGGKNLGCICVDLLTK